MLQWHIQILDSLWLFSKHIQESIADMGRIGVHHADPLDAVGVRKLAQQMRQGILFAEVFTVTRRILGDENQFLHAFFRELLSFGYDRSKTTAAKVAAHLRNKTERTGTIATLRDLYESVVTRRGQHAWC